jgi:hypothetical protein
VRPPRQPAGKRHRDRFTRSRAALDDKAKRCVVIAIGMARDDLDEDDVPSRLGDVYDAFNPSKH